MDNKIVLMAVVAIVLGMLVANMFKEVCGCKNLIEGQVVTTNGSCTDDNAGNCPPCDNGLPPVCSVGKCACNVCNTYKTTKQRFLACPPANRVNLAGKCGCTDNQ